MSDLKTKLLDGGNKKQGFEKMLQECQHRIKSIRQRNDHLQKNTGTQHQQEIADQLLRYRDRMEVDITELRDLIKKIEEKYKDPESRNKLKPIRAEATKQFERNRIIMREFVDKSFTLVEKHARESVQEHHHQSKKSVKENQRQTEPSEPRKVPREDVEDRERLKPNQSQPSKPVFTPVYHPEQNRQRRSVDTDEEAGQRNEQRQSLEQVEIDYELHDKLESDKREMLLKVEADINRLNDVMQDIGLEVEQQGNNLNIISQQLMRANENAVQAAASMDDANIMQRKSRKRNMCIVAVILLLVVTTVGVLLILKLI